VVREQAAEFVHLAATGIRAEQLAELEPAYPRYTLMLQKSELHEPGQAGLKSFEWIQQRRAVLQREVTYRDRHVPRKLRFLDRDQGAHAKEDYSIEDATCPLLSPLAGLRSGKLSTGGKRRISFNAAFLLPTFT
jgi:hypothetical protein